MSSGWGFGIFVLLLGFASGFSPLWFWGLVAYIVWLVFQISRGASTESRPRPENHFDRPDRPPLTRPRERPDQSQIRPEGPGDWY
jgi:threonine/homoserine/homoserine lactone efflux protein